MRLRRHPRRPGMSLLEVLTALAIFFLSVVAISQMVDTASQTAARAQRLTKAAIICESKMSEIVSGISPLQSVDQMAVEDGDPGWYYSIIVEPEDWTSVTVDSQSVTGLNTVHVTVGFMGPRPAGDVEYALSRIVLDPRLRKNAPEPTIAGTAASGSSSAGAGAPPSGSSGNQNSTGTGNNNTTPSGNASSGSRPTTGSNTGSGSNTGTGSRPTTGGNTGNPAGSPTPGGTNTSGGRPGGTIR